MRNISEKISEENPNNNIFYPTRCTFFVDTNNLVHSFMVSTILEKFDDDAIGRLNEVIRGMKFYVGGHQWRLNQKGYLKASTYHNDAISYNKTRSNFSKESKILLSK